MVYGNYGLSAAFNQSAISLTPKKVAYLVSPQRVVALNHDQTPHVLLLPQKHGHQLGEIIIMII